MSKKKAPEIAIDFGTARVKVAYYDEKSGTAKLASIGRDIREIIPSLFHIGEKNIEVGDAAADRAETDPKGLVLGIKRKIHLPGKIRLAGDRLQCSRVEIASYMFRHIREKLEKEKFYCPIQRCTLTVPVAFEEEKREKLRNAAINGGFQKISIIEEPVAAGRAWLRDAGHSSNYDSVIICDIGGGTTDFALLKRNGDTFISDPHVSPRGQKRGGDDLDKAIADIFQQNNDHYYPSDYLLLKFRKIREQLSHYKNKIPIRLQENSTEINQQIITNEISEFLDIILEDIKNYLETCNTAKIREDTPIVLIGGASRIQGLEDRVKQSTDRKVYCWSDSDYAVVLGAINIPKQKNQVSPSKSEKTIAYEMYKAAVEAVWADKEITEGELQYLASQQQQLHLSNAEVEEIEKNVCGATAKKLVIKPEPLTQNNLDDTDTELASIFICLGQMARAGGIITQNKTNIIKELIRDMDLEEKDQNFAMETFLKASNEYIDISEYLKSLGANVEYEPEF